MTAGCRPSKLIRPYARTGGFPGVVPTRPSELLAQVQLQ
jgi:hypothetical protein